MGGVSCATDPAVMLQVVRVVPRRDPLMGSRLGASRGWQPPTAATAISTVSPQWARGLSAQPGRSHWWPIRRRSWPSFPRRHANRRRLAARTPNTAAPGNCGGPPQKGAAWPQGSPVAPSSLAPVRRSCRHCQLAGRRFHACSGPPSAATRGTAHRRRDAQPLTPPIPACYDYQWRGPASPGQSWRLEPCQPAGRTA